mgnify:FL=1
MSWLRSLRLKPGDFVIAALVLALAAAASLPFLPGRTENLYAEIYQDQALLKRVLLTDGLHDTITIDGSVTNTIEIDGRSVRFSQSTCPDQVCVRTGTLTRSEQTAVCLPNRVIVRLTGGEPEIDAIAGGAVH